MVQDAPIFEAVADKIFNIMNNKLWAGHNISSFDQVHIIKQFRNIGREPPVCAGSIDTLPLLRSTFGKRAGNMKLASLAQYFGFGNEQHRALADARMTIEVLKSCSLALFLEQHYVLSDEIKEPQKTPEKSQKKTTLNKAEGAHIFRNNGQVGNSLERKKKFVWIIYEGGTIPNVPRTIQPLEWKHYKSKLQLKAICGITKQDKTFDVYKIREIEESKEKLQSKQATDKDQRLPIKDGDEWNDWNYWNEPLIILAAIEKELVIL